MIKEKLKKINYYYLAAFLLLLGFIGLNFWNGRSQVSIVQNYHSGQTEEQLAAARKKDEEFNQTLSGTLEFEDVYTSSNHKSRVNLFNADEPLGGIEVPKVNISLPIYEGTSERELQVGAGHLTGTSLPTGGENTRSVITAHRGLTTKRMFRDLDKLEIGDVFYVDTYGEKKAYEVYNKTVVEPTDVGAVEIVEGEDIVTLLTCEPYMINSHRLLVDGKRIPYDGEKIKDLSGKEKKAPKKSFWNWLKNLSLSLVDMEFILLLFVLLAAIIKWLLGKRKKKEEQHKVQLKKYRPQIHKKRRGKSKKRPIPKKLTEKERTYEKHL